MASTISLAEIPTVTLLYRRGELQAADPEDVEDPSKIPSPSAEYNNKLSLIRCDITKLKVDAIVNAANESLLGGGGVDGAIHRAAGPGLLDECETLDGCETGFAKITDGYELPAKKVIHAVGPVYGPTKARGMHELLLSSCYRRSLELAVANGCKSIAFSALSTGIYGYPSIEAADTALKTVRDFLDKGKGDSLMRIVFCVFMARDEDAYTDTIPLHFPPVEETDDKNEENAETAEASELGTEHTGASREEEEDTGLASSYEGELELWRLSP